MGNVIKFIPRSERERVHLIREARAIYDSIFPPADLVSMFRDLHNSPEDRNYAARPVRGLATFGPKRGRVGRRKSRP